MAPTAIRMPATTHPQRERAHRIASHHFPAPRAAGHFRPRLSPPQAVDPSGIIWWRFLPTPLPTIDSRNPPRDVEEQERDLARDDERTVGYKTHHEENEGDAFGGGGATVGFSYKLFIVPRGAKPNRTDELLLADKIGNASAVWSKPRILEIRYDQARIFRSKISGTAETLTTSSMWSNCGSFPLDHPSSATCTSRRSMMCLAWHPMIYVGHMTVPLARGAGESCRGHFSTGEGPAGSC